MIKKIDILKYTILCLDILTFYDLLIHIIIKFTILFIVFFI